MEDTKKDTQIGTWMNNLDIELDRAVSINDKFPPRLSDLMKDRDGEDMSSNEASELLVPLADKLRRYTNTLSDISNSYEAILRLLEI